MTTLPLPPKKPIQRPKAAASLLIIRWDDGAPKVLMGRRHAQHKFLPHYHVFPGGGLERSDYYMRTSSRLNEDDQQRLSAELRHNNPANAARAIALAAIRETFEETGLYIGIIEHEQAASRTKHQAWQAFNRNHISPNLACLHYFARAITPAGKPRRYDTRFFICHHNAIVNAAALAPSVELDELEWIALACANQQAANQGHLNLHPVTKHVMRLAAKLVQQQDHIAAPNGTAFIKKQGYSHKITLISTISS